MYNNGISLILIVKRERKSVFLVPICSRIIFDHGINIDSAQKLVRHYLLASCIRSIRLTDCFPFFSPFFHIREVNKQPSESVRSRGTARKPNGVR